MSGPPIDKNEKNFYQPKCEQEIIELVNYARTNSLKVRVRGSGHSMPEAIFTDGCNADNVDVEASAPDGDDINILLDRYNNIVSRNGNFVTVEAGIHLGHNPMDWKSTLENSMLYQIDQYGLAVDALGGISHQTVGGFLSTGSAGGTLTYSTHENVHALRFIDGNGSVFTVSRDDNCQDHFNAALISLGLLGVLSQVSVAGEKKTTLGGVCMCFVENYIKHSLSYCLTIN